jgi:hypothetical protein
MMVATIPATNDRPCLDARRAKEKAVAAPTARPELSSTIQIRLMVEAIMFPRSFASCEAISTVQEVKYGIRAICA